MFKRIVGGILAAVIIIGLFAAIPLRASAVNQMRVSESCVAFLKQIEGFNATPFWDYAQWTVGFGTKCPDADLEKYKQEGIPLEKAEQLLAEAMVYFGNEVNKFMVRNNHQLTQQQFDALFSLVYNLGPSILYSTDNRLIQAVLKGCDPNEFVYLMGLRCNAGGKFLPALLKRRIMEADMYLNGRYDAKVNSDYGTVLYDAGNGTCEARGQGYNMNQPAEPLAMPTYSGYTFTGWYSSASGGYRVTQLDYSTNGMTLYAHWEKADSGVTGTPVDNVKVKVLSSSLYARSGPGVQYSAASLLPKGTELVITAVAQRDGAYWGKCSAGWVSLGYTDYQPEQQPNETGTDTMQLPALATALTNISIYNGPHTSYPKIGTLGAWNQVQVQEVKIFMQQLWAKTDRGWVKMDKNLLVHDSSTLVHFADVTITNSYLNVRSGPGTSYPISGSFASGEKVRIVAVELSGTSLWGRCDKGWISLQYTSFEAGQLDRYRTHTFGAWSEIEAATCTQQGLERRECTDCGYFETQTSKLKEHSFGDWYECEKPTYTTPGQERRDCKSCDHFELRYTDVAPQPTVRIFGTVTGCDTLNVRSGAGTGNALVGKLSKGDRVEILEQKNVNEKIWGRTEKGWICITGYVTVETEITGQEKPEPSEDAVFGTVTGANALNVREKPGTQNALVGQLKMGQRVQFFEAAMVGTKMWGRTEIGWVCITGYITLESELQLPQEPEKPQNPLMTVTAGSLSIRSGAGTTFSVVGYLQYGQQVEVLEKKDVNGSTWARIDRGWVSMKYLK